MQRSQSERSDRCADTLVEDMQQDHLFARIHSRHARKRAGVWIESRKKLLQPMSVDGSRSGAARTGCSARPFAAHVRSRR